MPDPLIMVTVAVAPVGVPPTAPTEHTPAVPDIVGMTAALVVVVTVKLLL